MITLNKETRDQLIQLKTDLNIGLEGNIIKVIDTNDDPEFQNYLNDCKEQDTTIRRKRLEITSKVQEQNKELTDWQEKNRKIQKELEQALLAANKAKIDAETNLDILVKKNQYELINGIIRTSLVVIIGVGVLTTMLYFYTLYKGVDNQIIESTWANMFSILLTNSFSIIGTIMGVKHMQSPQDKK